MEDSPLQDSNDRLDKTPHSPVWVVVVTVIAGLNAVWVATAIDWRSRNTHLCLVFSACVAMVLMNVDKWFHKNKLAKRHPLVVKPLAVVLGFAMVVGLFYFLGR